jgi:RNA polymerase sigma factor (sigma-70 family)
MEDGYEKLLACLDSDPEGAARKFEELRRKLVWLFGWWGAQFPEDLADETLARIAKNLAKGEVIKNLRTYCNGVAKNVWREHLKKPQHPSIDDDNFPDPPNGGNDDDTKDAAERRAQCLDECLAALPPESRYLINEYYCCSGAELIERRRQLAKQFGLAREALANRAQRLRHKLEECITRCERKISAT